jgi:Rieske Fe-S protein
MRDLDTRKLAGGGDPTKAAVSDGVTQAGKTRRTVLAGAGAVGVAGVLAACGGADGSGGGGSPGAASATGAAGGEVKTSEVPVGGGIVVAAKRFVVTQPTPGTFKAFDATCTHQGCEVATVSAGKINCPCHGSQYNIADGSVARGPAASPLATKRATVSGDTITVS